ncbi:alpha/beta fold hydrolase [Streptomyces sp. NPDC019937]|uniref:alpha/beta hydrolase n=1 Tax=Streptomyces sp. NPDC019937 TaxID=3154787 RepID=UPI003405278F
MTGKTAALAVATAATASVLATVSSADASEGKAASPPLAWGTCDGEDHDARQECATLSVPLNYHDPDGKRITLAVSRVRSERPDARRGTLLLIPGGPGGSGLNRPTTYGERLPQPVRDAYDLVSFDPRGLGGSTHADCGLADEDLSLARARPWPAADGEITENVATARRIADACARNGGDLVRSLSTVNEARDIDSIRRALGERKLSAWGTSYGTYVGSVYAQLYPERTDRWVLDSNDDPDPTRVERGWLANLAVGVEDSFPAFATFASSLPEAERLADTPAGVRRVVLDLAARLDAEPLPRDGADQPALDGTMFRQSVLTALYSQNNFKDLAPFIKSVRDGHAPAETPGRMTQDAAAVSYATLCNDVEWPRSVSAYARDVAAGRASHPLTAGMPVNITPCAFWPDKPQDKPVRITDRGPSNVLLVQNRHDVATPYSGALNLRRAFGDRARMVGVDSTGHGAAYVPAPYTSSCADRAVTDYLVRGERPAGDVSCPAPEEAP